MKQFLVCLFMAIGFTATAQSDSAWFRNNYTKKEMYITMRDGVKLFTAVYMPNSTAEKHPILMSRTPYSAGLTAKKIMIVIYVALTKCNTLKKVISW